MPELRMDQRSLRPWRNLNTAWALLPRYSGTCAWCSNPLASRSLQPHCVDCLNHRVMCVFIVDQMDTREEHWTYQGWRKRFQQLMGFAFGKLTTELKLHLAQHCCELGLVHGYNGNWWGVYHDEDLPAFFEAAGLKKIPQAEVAHA